jgi:hypothetical protein
MRMRRHFPAGPVTDPCAEEAAAPIDPPELAARIAALESTGARTDFDALSWFWMILFGILVPLVLLILGWQA